MVAALKSSKVKLAFVLPWLLYLALELILAHKIFFPASGFTLLFLYLLGGGAEMLASRVGAFGPRSLLLLSAGGLAAADQLGKLAVGKFLPMGKEITLIPASFSLRQTLNLSASWLPNKFEFALPLWFLFALAVFLMFLVVAVYNYYTGVHQKTVYTDLALVLLLAGALSASADYVLRGVTVDYLAFQGLFVADLKDILLTLGLASVLAESMLTPAVDPGLKELPALFIRIIKYNLGKKQGARARFRQD